MILHFSSMTSASVSFLRSSQASQKRMFSSLYSHLRNSRNTLRPPVLGKRLQSKSKSCAVMTRRCRSKPLRQMTCEKGERDRKERNITIMYMMVPFHKTSPSLKSLSFHTSFLPERHLHVKRQTMQLQSTLRNKREGHRLKAIRSLGNQESRNSTLNTVLELSTYMDTSWVCQKTLPTT